MTVERAARQAAYEEAAKTRMRFGNLGILTAAVSAPLGAWMYFAHRRATLTPSYAPTMAFELSPAHGWVGLRVQF